MWLTPEGFFWRTAERGAASRAQTCVSRRNTLSIEALVNGLPLGPPTSIQLQSHSIA